MANKWIPLDGKKEPDFHQEILIINQSGYWDKGWLKEINETHVGKSYVFSVEEKDDVKDATHFMEVELPRSNQ